ncbi:MAG: metal-dependent hydrolase [Halosimplex sp.]
MWPWEHIAVGYVLLSVYSRARTGTPPPELSVFVLAAATQLPDLVDKPLAWQFDVLDGTAVAHSILVALALAFLAGIVAGRIGRPLAGSAFAIGYVSHLLGDLAYPMILGRGHFAWGAILWPGPNRVVTDPSPAPSGSGTAAARTGSGFVSTAAAHFGEFASFLGTPAGRAYLLFDLVLVGGALALWTVDGWPGIHVVVDAVRSGWHGVRS